jgi:hypothetical protein
MRLPRLTLAAPLLAVALLSPARVSADDTSDFLKPDNWEGRTDLWTINGTTIVGETKEDPKYNTFFCSKKKYADFELTCKVQLRDGAGNSGIQIRSTIVDPAKFVVAGPQADIGAGYWGSLYGERFDKEGKVGGGHMMKQSPPDKVKTAVKAGEFNDYSVRAVGKKVTIKVGGETMVDEEFAILPPDGIIAFQIHAGFPKMRVEFKDIKFTDLGKKK